MADKNLHDIKIDELDSPKKTPLKNILTLLALLFIILVISVVITKLILNTDDAAKIDSNESTVALAATNSTKEGNTTATTKDADLKVPTLNPTTSIRERNLSSVIKPPLLSHEPKEMRTYKTPKKSSTTTASETPKKSTHSTVTKTKTVKKEYITKTKHISKKKTSKAKNASYLGGQEKAVSNSYYIKVGTYRNAATIVAKIKKNNFNYSLVKLEDDKTLTRVLVGPFFSQNQANAQLAKVKANILSGAYVTKAK